MTSPTKKLSASQRIELAQSLDLLEFMAGLAALNGTCSDGFTIGTEGCDPSASASLTIDDVRALIIAGRAALEREDPND